MSLVIVFMSLFPLIVFLSLFWGLFDFSLLRTHFCLITKYSVEFRAALRGNFARGAHLDEDVPKGGPGSDNSAFRMTLGGPDACDSCSCFQRTRIGTAPRSLPDL
jgi:hypothetical protein